MVSTCSRHSGDGVCGAQDRRYFQVLKRCSCLSGDGFPFPPSFRVSESLLVYVTSSRGARRYLEGEAREARLPAPTMDADHAIAMQRIVGSSGWVESGGW